MFGGTARGRFPSPCGQASGPHPAPPQVWSTGHTLGAWEKELRAAGASDVLAVSWKPGAPPPEGWRRLTKRKAATEEPGGRHGVVRLFAFGKEKAREKVRTSVRDWDAQLDWFVA